MEIPESLSVNENISADHSVACKLRKFLYRLKQAPRCWNYKFSSFLKKFNLKETNADKCIFFGEFEDSEVYLALFVDDGIIAAKSLKVLKSIRKTLSEQFEITIGDSSNFEGLEISRNREQKTMFIHQSMYTKRISQKFGMEDAKGVRTR